MSHSLNKVIEIVQNYVYRCGGSVPIEYLLQDYKTAYNCELPCAQFGYLCVEDFLVTVPGILVFDDEDGTFVESVEYSARIEEQIHSQTDHLDDLTQLSVQMKNNLLLDCRDVPRVVKIESSNVNKNYKKFLNRNNSRLLNHSEETGGNKSLSSGSVRSLNIEVLCNNDYLPGVDNVSTYDDYSGTFASYQTPYENAYATSVVNDDSQSPEKFYESVYSLDLNQSTSLTDKLFKSSDKQYEGIYSSDVYRSTVAPGDLYKSQETLYEDVYKPGVYPFAPSTSNFSKSQENLYDSVCIPKTFQSTLSPKNVSKSQEKLHESVFTPDVFKSTLAPNNVSKSQEKLFETQVNIPDHQFTSAMSSVSECQEKLFASISSPDVYQSTSVTSRNVHRPRSIYEPTSCTSNGPTMPADLLVNTKPQNTFFMNGSGDWIPEEAYRSSFTNEWLDKLSEVTNNEIVERVVELVNLQTQTGGVDSLTIELKYCEKHSTKLPKYWLKLLEESSRVYMEKLKSCVIVYPNRWFPVVPTLSSLPAMRFPNVKYHWNIHIQVYENTACVWFRLTDDDFDLKYDTLRTEMNKHYRRAFESIKHLNEVESGQLCAVHYKNEWYRGEVLEFDSKKESARCLLIDNGIIQNYCIAKVYQLHEKFTNTPALAIQGTLSGLEKWENCNYINCKIRKLLLDEQDVNMKIEKFLDHMKVSMQIFIAQNSQFLDLNSKMIELARNELTLPILYSGQMYDVNVISVSENNSAQIQIISPSLTLLEETLRKVATLMKDDKNRDQARVKTMFDLKQDKIYVARCEDGQWRRIVCRQFHLSMKVRALFIDYAEVKTVYLHDIFETAIMPDTVSFIEPQAILVQMMDVDAIVLRCLKNLKNTGIFSMKILRTAEGPPMVQFFGKLPGTGYTPVTNILNAKFNVAGLCQ